MVGSSASTSHAQTGANGVSNALMSAVSDAGSRFAPAAMVTDAMANKSPNVPTMAISWNGAENGSPAIHAIGTSNNDNKTAGPAAGAAG